MDDSPLDNPSWHALSGRQIAFAEGSGLVRRYRPEVSVFAAFEADTPQAWAELAELAGAGRDIVLNRRGPIQPPPGWTTLGAGSGHQMVLEGEAVSDHPAELVPLGDEHVEDMVALVALTEPGPFRRRTIELGGYLGVFDEGRLVAMAGQRVGLDDFTEISAVCTHPDARRRGLAAAVTAGVARSIRAEGRTPILHVAEHNTGAKRVYDQLGFTVRTMLTFAALRTPGSGSR